MAASPLPSHAPERGRNCYVTLAISGVPNQEDTITSGCLIPAFSGAQKRADLLCKPGVRRRAQTRGQNQNRLPHPCLLGGAKRGRNYYVPLAFSKSPKQGKQFEVVASTLPSWGALKRGEWQRNNCVLGHPQTTSKSEVAAPPMPSQGPKRGQNCYATPPLAGKPKQVDKIETGCLTLAFSGGGGAPVLCNPSVLGESPNRETKSEVVASPLPSWEPKRGCNCYITTVFSGVPKQGDKIRSD